MGSIRKSLESWGEVNKPQLISEWHPTKNLPLTPATVGLSYKDKLWWLGECGHEWQATIQSRRKCGCPMCSNRKVCTGFNDLATTHPELSLEWHPTKNGDLRPTDVIAGSEKIVWWICPRGHSYDARLCERKIGNGCPYCIGKRPALGETDLATVKPKLAREWHPTKNGDLKPENFTAGSGKKVWWICDKGHEWRAVISSRAAGNNCPYCGSQKLLPGFNDLATIRPEWAKEWHPTKNGDITPSMIFPSTGKKYWWICEKGHEWDSSPNNRCKSPMCPYCSGDRAIPGETDALTLYPELKKQWHPTKNRSIDPGTLTPHSLRKAWWMCEKGHEWQVPVSYRTSGNSCPFCSGHRVIPGETDLATVYPEIAKEWHPTKNGDLKPCDVKPNSALKVWWMCEKGHEWSATLSDRSRSKGCPFCSLGRQASFNEKAILVCLEKTFPELEFESNYTRFRKQGVSELDIFIPSIDLAIEYDGPRHTNYERDSRKSEACRNLGITLLRVKEHLRKGDESRFPDVFAWVTDHAQANEMNEVIRKLEFEISSRAGISEWESHADMLKYRSEINEILIVHPEKSFSEAYPDKAKEWHPTKNGTLLPTEVYASSNRKAWWMCDKGHEWEAVINSRKHNGCPYCSNHRIIVGENDLATTHPQLTKEWHPTKNGDLKPSDVVSGTNKKAWWMCDKGHEWEAVINHRVHGGGCPYCNVRRLYVGFNDLETKNPELAKEWHPTKNGDLKPSDVAWTIIKKVWWMCDKGHEWEAAINSRNRGARCPYCSGHRAIPGQTDLATVRPDMVKEWHPTRNGDLKPSDLLPNSHRLVWWLCKKGHEWRKAPNTRGECPLCSKKNIAYGDSMLSDYPDLLKQWHPTKNDIDPDKIPLKSKELFWWRCENGHEWQSSIDDRLKSGGTCIECFFI